MATTFTDLTGDGGATKQFSFPSIKEADIKVEVDAVDYENRGITGASSGTTTFTITSYTTTGGGNVVFDSAPGSGALIRIYRDTDVDTPKATYTAGSSIKAGDLNNNQTQLLYAAQEEQNQTVITADIKNEAITTAKIKDQNVNTSKLANDAVTGAKIADDAINSEHYVDGSIDTAHIADNAVTTAKIPDDAITGPKLGTDSIDGHNIQDNSINSEHYIDGSIDTAHIADAQITTAKIVDSNVTTAKIADSNITTAKIADDAVTNAKIADGTLDGRYYTETELDAGQLDNRYFTETELSNGSLDSRYFTETELTNGALDGRYFTETEADARYFNISASETIKDGDTFPDNDTTIATTAAINDRIIDLVDDVGGFVPIANETSFPNANPDVNNGTGTLISIKALSQNLTSNSSGTISITNGTVGNSTVTITGAANSTTYAATFGMIVETTSTLNTYTFHRLVPKATEVSTVSGSISNVNTVAGAISNVNTAAGNITNINTVAGINANVTTVAGISSDVTTVANNNSNVTAVAGNASNINSAVSNASNINSAVSNASNINSAVSNESNINSAVSNASNINTVAGSISNVNTAATNIASINTAASNITNVNNFADVYQIASSNPSTDGGGNAVAEGDLYFNTTANRLKVYDGANWVDGVAASSGGGVQTTGATFTGDVKLNDDVNFVVGTGDDLKIYHNGTDSYFDNATGITRIRNTGTNGSQIQLLNSNQGIKIQGKTGEQSITALANGKVELYHDNSKKLETQSGGVGITGDITVSGNVDGRDVAADGSKLDGIEASATADQTASEIVTLLSDQTITANGLIMTDNKSILLGASDDFRIRHTGSHSEITDEGTGNLRLGSNQVIIGSPTFDETSAKFVDDGAVQLYYDNSKKFETTSAGILVDNQIKMSDAGALIIGSDNDVNINHSGSNFQIHNDTGNIYLDTVGTHFIRVGSGNEAAIDAIADGAVKLYYNGVQRFQTMGAGIEVTAPEAETAGIYLTADEGDDNNDYWRMLSTTTAKLLIQNYGSGAWETSIECNADGNVELYYDNSIKAFTYSDGLHIGTGTLRGDDNAKVVFGDSSDLQIYHDGSHSYVDGTTTGDLYLRSTSDDVIVSAADDIVLQVQGSETGLRCNGNGSVDLYYDNSKKLETTSWGVQVSGTVKPTELNMDDNHKLQLGNSADLRLYHDGSNSYITDVGTGSLLIDGSAVTFRTGSFTVNNAANSENMLYAAQDGGVYLYYNSSNKLETINTGIKVGGEIWIGNSDTQIEEGANNSIRHVTNAGHVDIGPQNGSYTHYVTDRPKHWFNTLVEINGHCQPHSNTSYNLGSSSLRWSTAYCQYLDVSGTISGVGAGKAIAVLRERQSHDVPAGTFSSGADRVRQLNVEEHDGESFCTLDVNTGEFTLPAGTYLIYFEAGGYDCGAHRTKIVTDGGTDKIFGLNVHSHTSYPNGTTSSGFGVVTNSSTEGYYLKHRCTTSRATNGLGRDMNFASEQEFYATVVIFRID